jgi:hypothetical protein
MSSAISGLLAYVVAVVVSRALPSGTRFRQVTDLALAGLAQPVLVEPRPHLGDRHIGRQAATRYLVARVSDPLV